MSAGRDGGPMRTWLTRGLLAVTSGALIGAAAVVPATAAPAYPSDTPPDLIPALSGYSTLWQTSGLNDLHGTVKDKTTLQFNDRVASWVNQHATGPQQFRALQNSAYKTDGVGYDQSLTIADGLGTNLGALYVRGRLDGKLPLTSALIDSSTGTTGAYEPTGPAKATFSYPRPYLPSSATSAPASGDSDDCTPSKVNASSLTPVREGKAWASTAGRLRITRVPATTDTTHAFSDSDVALDVGYGTKSLCTGGSYPSGHTTTAYEAGITLATLLPELAPEILTRASEAGNNRIVLGVHYPLDIIGGRIDGEIALSARWSDGQFRDAVLTPARAELVGYLQTACGARLAVCIKKDTPYVDNPYGGAKIPRGTSQKVTNRKSALKVYTERLSYGFKPTGSTKRSPSVPAGAGNLLRTTFPTLTNAQRKAVLAQTETRSGNPLDTTATHRHGTAPGSWQRLNLAAATSATVRIRKNGKVVVLSVGGNAKVKRAG